MTGRTPPARRPEGKLTVIRAGGLRTGLYQADLEEPFTYETEPAVWLVAQWKLSPKLRTGGRWFPC